MSTEVLEGQKWLNETYGGNQDYQRVEETGLPGTAFSEALVSAAQIVRGIRPVSGVFGETTSGSFDSTPLVVGNTGNLVKILQYGLYGKGYNPGSADGHFTQSTINALRQIQTDAGLTGGQVSDKAAGMQMKAVLGVDEYKQVSGGDAQVRLIQQTLNRQYLEYSGLCAADGVYGRSTNSALIFALQAEEGLPVDMATGNFGSTTKACCPDLGTGQTQYGYGNVPYSQASMTNFTKLVQYALYCVGIDRYTSNPGSKYHPLTFDGALSSSTLDALHSFQSDYALPQRNTVLLDEWMGLLLSTGNPNRDGTAADCSTRLSAVKARAVKGDGYNMVGRYLTGTAGYGDTYHVKNLTPSEIQNIFNAGLDLFVIYQDDEDWWQNHSDLSGYFSYGRGYSDAVKAVQAAYDLGIPMHELIYFAVDYDYMEGEVYQKVIPHFQGVKEAMAKAGNPYRIGIYGARNTCGIVCANGLAESSFVSDMSTGYSGNLGYPLPSNWAFDQIQEYPLPTADGTFDIDKNVASGRYSGFSKTDGTFELPTPEATYQASAFATTADIDAAKAAKIGAYISLEYYGTNGFSWNMGDTATYRLVTTSVANLLNSADTLSNRIRSVTVEVVAGENVWFDTIDQGRFAACFPPVGPEEETEIEALEGKIFGKLAKAALKLVKADKFFTLLEGVEFFTSLTTKSSETVMTGSRLMKRFAWSSLQNETVQAFLFHPILKRDVANHSFTVKYTVAYDNGDAFYVEKEVSL